MEVERKLAALGLVLPPPMKNVRGDVRLPFVPVVVQGSRALVAGHGPVDESGTLAPPFGVVGDTIDAEQGYLAARAATLAILGDLRRELGDLDRVRRWVRIFGIVSSAPGFQGQAAVVNGCSELLVELYGPLRGSHVRTAIGAVGLPFGMAVEIEAEVEIDP